MTDNESKLGRPPERKSKGKTQKSVASKKDLDSRGPRASEAKRGRPTKYPEIEKRLDEIEELAGFGLTIEQIANFLKIAPDTMYRYQNTHPEFSESIKRGKVKADTKVKKSLYERANGYQHHEDKIFLYEGEPIIVPTIKHYPPDTAAAFIWLKNRCGWQDKLDVTAEVTQKPAIDYTKLSTDELKKLESLLRKAKPDESI